MTYHYNLQNRLQRVITDSDPSFNNNDVSVVDYTYNTSGIRTSKYSFTVAQDDLDTVDEQANAAADGGTYYRLPGSQRQIGHLEAWFYDLPSSVSRYMLIALAAITLAVLLGPSSAVLYRRMRKLPRCRRSRLGLYHRTLCILLAWIFLTGPEMFQQAAYADSQYTQISTFTWADGNQTIEYGYDANGSLISKITYKRDGQDLVYIEGRRYDYTLQNRLAKVWDMDSDETDSGGLPGGYNRSTRVT